MSGQLGQILQNIPTRIHILVFALGFCFAIIGLRSIQIAVYSDYIGKAHIQSTQPRTMRAEIIDRNGELLATTVTVYSLFADPRMIWDGSESAARLVQVFPELDQAQLAKRLNNRDRAFVWVKRGLTPQQRQTVMNLGLEGLNFREEQKRIYPKGGLAAHVLGFTDLDGNGLAGLEYSQDKRLKQDVKTPLQLTLDSAVQYTLETELERTITQHGAQGGAGIVMNARNGEIIAMASWPPINPNRPADNASEHMFNRATSGVYELGSVFKPLTIAAGLDSGLLKASDKFNLFEPIKIGNFTLMDQHPYSADAKPIDIIAHSSNVGVALIALQLGKERQRAYIENMGLTDKLPISLSENAAPILPNNWDDVHIATIGYGHGIAISPLAFTAAFSVLANHGEYIAPRLIKNRIQLGLQPRRVLSAQTARLVRGMLREAVMSGTGRQAERAGYRIGGKTGSAEKPFNGRYDKNRLITSFAAIFPIDKPKYTVFMMLDEPQSKAGNRDNAAWNVAPGVGNLIADIAPILGVAPEFDHIPPINEAVRVRNIDHRRAL